MNRAKMLERVGEHELQLQLRLEYWRMGFAAGERAHADDYASGYAAAVADLKAAQHAMHRVVTSSAPLWAAHWRSLREAAGS